MSENFIFVNEKTSCRDHVSLRMDPSSAHLSSNVFFVRGIRLEERIGEEDACG